MNILKDINELLAANIISPAIAENITAYYQSKKSDSPNRLIAIFSVIGALLVGLGIILILAHNWDDLSKTTKTILAFLPLIFGQLCCGFTLVKKQESMAWREASATFLFLSIGSCIALISQIYNLGGELSDFIFTWMLLTLPIVYIMRSSMGSLLYILGITYYVCIGNWYSSGDKIIYYWALLLGIIYFYYLQIKDNPKSNFTSFHHWLIPFSIIVGLFNMAHRSEEYLIISLMSLFGGFIALSKFEFFNPFNQKYFSYKLIGYLGTFIGLLFLSFESYWANLRESNILTIESLSSVEFYFACFITLLSIFCLIYNYRKFGRSSLQPISVVFLVFILIFSYGINFYAAHILINCLILILGILMIKDGANQSNLAKMNFGLIVIAILIACRFFDTDISFVWRGILFLVVGLGFFFVNYWVLKKSK